MDSVRMTSTMAGAEAPAAALLSRRRPRLARRHMGSTHTADMLESSITANANDASKKDKSTRLAEAL